MSVCYTQRISAWTGRSSGVSCPVWLSRGTAVLGCYTCALSLLCPNHGGAASTRVIHGEELPGCLISEAPPHFKPFSRIQLTYRPMERLSVVSNSHGCVHAQGLLSFSFLKSKPKKDGKLETWMSRWLGGCRKGEWREDRQMGGWVVHTQTGGGTEGTQTADAETELRLALGRVTSGQNKRPLPCVFLTEAPLLGSPRIPPGVPGPGGWVRDAGKGLPSSVKREQKRRASPRSGGSVSPVCWVFSLPLAPRGHKMATACARQAEPQ